MRTSALVLALGLVAAVAACHRAPSSSSSSGVTPEPALVDPQKAVAVRDLRDSLAATRAAVQKGQSPVYAADKLALAARELAGEKDPGVLALLSEAETVYGHDAPVAWADAKIKDATAHADKRADDCATARDMLARVSPKYKEEAGVLELQQRVKALCPRVRERSSGGGSSSSGPSRAAQRDDCRRRCDDAAFDCRSRCQYCGSCTSDKTWDQCNAICNNCRQGCEQNERFCQSACGS